jgi:hypothetical protein
MDLCLAVAALSGFTTQFNDNDHLSLALCSDLLHRHRPEPTISPEKIAEIFSLLDELESTIENDHGLERELRFLLLGHVWAMRRAVQAVPVFGSAGLRATLAQTIGDLGLNPDLVVRKDTSPKTWEKAVAVLNVVAAALSLGASSFTALEASPTPAPPAVVVKD